MPRRSSTNDNVTGSNRSELIYTGRGDDTINANAGNDVIFSGSGNDTVNAGSGNDIIFAGSGNDEIHGGNGNDLIYSGSGDDKIDGGFGNDRIFGGSGNDVIDGGTGNDLIFGGSGEDKIDGGAGRDRIFGGSGADEIDGGKGNDLIFGGSGDDVIDGGEGNDRIFGGYGDDKIDGGDGNDLIFGGSGADTIDGGDGRDRVYAGSGSDTLIYTLPDSGTSSSLSPDYYNGGTGFDTLRINLTTAQTGDADLIAELSDYLDALDAGTSSYYVRLPSLNLAVASIEAVQIYVDGVLTDIRDIGGGDVVAVDDSFTLGEDGTLADSVASNDTAPTGATFTLVTPVTQGTLALNADGTFTFDPDGTYESLAVGETATQQFTYQLSQGGETATATATITITGANDAPTVSAAVTAALAEDDASASINLLQGAADVDNGSTLSVANVTGLVAGVSLSGTNLEVDTSDPSIQALAAGQTMEVTVSYDVVDEHGASVAQTATVTITGANDAPVVTGAITKNVIEDTIVLTVDLLEGASDPDAGATLAITNVSALPAGFTLTGTELTVDPYHAAFQSLAAGATQEFSVTYEIIDGNGGSVAQIATISVGGTNDAPTVSAAITAGAQKDDTDFNVDLLQFASDIDEQTTLSIDNVTGLTDGVTLSGTTLSVDPSHAAFAGLGPDDTREIIVSFNVIDGDGGSVAQTATITITGSNSNQPPVVTGPVEADVSEDASSGVDINLLAGASDPDGTAPLTVQNVSSLPQGFTLSGSTLTVDPSHASYQALPIGETIELEITYDIADELGATVAQTATITIVGQNDLPEVAAALTGSATEDGDAVEIDLLAGATDVDTGTVLDIANVSALPDGVTLSGTTLTVDPSHAAFQSIAAGTTREITISYDVVDGDGGTVAQTATITVTGTNDTPVVAAALTGSATEDGDAVEIDLLAGATDVDTGTVLDIANVSALPDGVTLSGTTLTIDPTNAAFQSIAAGATREITISYDVVDGDGDGGTVAQTATITVTGTNDAPVVAAALTGSATEDGDAVEINLLAGATDVDTGTVLDIANVSALPDGVTLSGTTLTVDPSHAAFQSIAAGATREITISYDVVDGDGGTVAQTATITVTGTNDAPVVAAALTGSATEDGDAVEINLLAGATDVDTGTVLDIANVSALPDGVTLSGTTLTIDPSHAAFQSIAAGATREITISYDVVDGDGGTVAQTATITVTGTNDAPVVAAALTGSATEDGDAVEIDLLAGATDVDTGTVLDIANVSALPDGVTLSGTTLTVDPSHAAFQSIAAGATLEIIVSYDVVDGDGGTVAQTATITVTGTNDAPVVAAALTGSATEDGDAVEIDLLAGATDVDTGTVLDIANVSALPDGVTLSGTTLTVDPSHAAFQSIAAGATREIIVSYDVVDGDGGTVAQTATITVTGTNDTPVIAAALTGSATEDGDAVEIDLLAGATDVDTGTVLDIANVSALPDGVTLSGTTLTVDPSHATFQSIAAGATREITISYDVVDGDGGTVAQTATITVTGTNDTPVVAAALTGSATEDGDAVEIDLLAGATDVDTGTVLDIANVSALPDGVTLSGTTLTVDPSHAAFQSIAAGATQDIVVSYNVVDGVGGSVSQTATITITGINDAPTIAGALTESANEDDAEFTVSLLTGADDVDEGTTLDIENITGLVSGLSLSADGLSLVVDPGDPSFQVLARGEELDLVVTYNIVDGDGGTVPQNLTVTITGTNDTPTVAAVLSETAAEDSAVFTLSLLNGADDVDRGAALTVQNVSALIPGATLSELGILTVDPSHANFQTLNVGQTEVLTLQYDVTDEFGASVAQTATITITGTNDIPTVDAALVAETDEDDAVLTVNLLEGASDIDDGADLNVADVTGMGPGFTLNGNSLEIDPSVAAYQSIALNESVTYTVNYNVVDEHGASVAQSATITINGTNDAPVATGTVDTQYTVTDVAYSMTLDPDLFFDIDTSDTLTLSATLANGDPLPTWLTFDAATGTFSGTPNNQQHAQLFRIEVTATDPHGASATAGFWMGQGDTLNSGTSSSSETVSGASFNGDILFGGEGMDRLSGLNQSDLYVVTIDHDLTVIQDNGNFHNDILLLDDIAPADVMFDRRHLGSYDLVISVAGVPLVLIIDTLDLHSNDEISFVAFGDGSIVPIADIRATLISQAQTTGADIVAGFEGADTINGETGNDYLTGLQGTDTYVFNTGDGQDVIEENGFGNTDVVQFADRASTDATFSRVPGQDDSVLISFANGDSVLLRHGLDGSAADGIEEVQFLGDGVTLTADQVRDILVSQNQTSGDDTITGFSRGETIEAGLGNDYIDGAGGADTYIFNSGDGQDVIDDNGFSHTDSIVFTNYALADATFERVGVDFNDFVISFANGDQVYVNDSLNGQLSGSIEQVIFQGTGSDELLTIANIRAIIFAQMTTTGNDNIDVGSSNLVDILEGGQGDDFLSGRDGSDTYIFRSGDGRDVIHDNGNGDTDVLDLSDFASTDMTVRFEWGSITTIVLSFATGEEITIVDQTTLPSGIESFIFSDTTLTNIDIKALADASTLPGDLFTGTIGADTLSGDGGHDFLQGGNGNDTYVFDAGDERVEIRDGGGGGNTVVVNGYSSTDATFMRVGGLSTDLRIVLGGGDEIFIHNTLGTSSPDTIASFTFNGDGVTLSIAEVRQILVDDQSTAGDDNIFGFADSDTLDGGTGDDYLSGGRGSDTYIFDVGDGNDVILDDGVGGTDRIEINGYDFSAATFTRVPGATADVLIDFGSGDSIRMGDVLADSLANGIEQIVFNGPGGSQTITMAEIRNILTSDQATAGDDTIFGSRASETLEGGLGDDYLSGGRNGDTYVYTFGDGNDVIEDNGGGSGDVLQLNGITFDNFSVARAIDRTNDVVLTIADGGTVRLVNSLAEAFVDSIETISLVDEGVALTMQDLREQILLQDSTSGDDDITGWSSNDTIMGGAGNDFLTGQGGSDTYIFNVGDGNDTVLDQGGANTDAITFNDRDIADATFSRLFDASNDLLIEFSNGDSVVVRETIPGGFVNRIEQYNFDDGTLSHADMVALL